VSGGWDDTVRVWQVETQELLATVTLDSPVWAVAADAVRGTIYAGVRSGTIAVIDVASGAAIRSLEPGWPVMALALAPDGGTLAAGGGWRDEPAPIQVWDLESGLVSHVLHGHSDPVTCLAYHPDGQRLASGSNDRSVRIWDVAHGLEALSLHGHRREIQCLAFDRSGGKLATAGWDGTVIVWDGTPVKIHFSGQ
jgi:WD40 repeat protein